MSGLTLKDVAHNVIHQSKTLTPRQLAEDHLAMSYSMLVNAVNPDLDGFKLAARHIIPITKLTNDFRIMDYMEAGVGRVAFALPELSGEIDDLQAMVAANVKEFGDVLQVLGKVLASGRIDNIDLKRIELEILEQVRTAMGLLESAKRVCEEA